MAETRKARESAGFEPRPVLQQAVSAMKLIGIDISGARSSWVEERRRLGLLPRLQGGG